jgi:HTH-type transcriptional regulator/antitoxin HigA
MDIRPIKTVQDYDAALAEIEQLWGAEADTPEGDKLDVLITLVEAYENKHYPIDPPDPIDAILFRMEQGGLDRKALEPFIGKSGRVSEVLNRKRPLSIDMIRNLWEGLHIPLESLIRRSDHNHRQHVHKGRG